jgi:hypothetical protein
LVADDDRGELVRLIFKDLVQETTILAGSVEKEYFLACLPGEISRR